jgi:hypothetical protein
MNTTTIYIRIIIQYYFRTNWVLIKEISSRDKLPAFLCTKHSPKWKMDCKHKHVGASIQDSSICKSPIYL